MAVFKTVLPIVQQTKGGLGENMYGLILPERDTVKTGWTLEPRGMYHASSNSETGRTARDGA